MSFVEIVKRNSNRKCEYGTDKVCYHSYGDFYESLIKIISTRDDPSILEIGVCTGAFLHALREFMPHAILEGLDIDTSKFLFPNDRIFIRQGNSLDSKEAKGQYDLIIDDGMHTLENQVQTFRNFAPLVKNNGFYVVEDIITNNSKHVFQDLAHEYNMILVWEDFSSTSSIPDDRLAFFIRSN
jgi:hypothetical protein